MILITLFVCNLEVDAGPQEDRLLEHFFVDNKYYPTSRPVANDSDSVLVRFGVTKLQTFELVRFQLFEFVTNSANSLKFSFRINSSFDATLVLVLKASYHLFQSVVGRFRYSKSE